MPWRFISAFAVCALVAGCSGRGDHASSTVQVFAAASLADAFAAVEEAFEEERPDLDVQLNIAGSSGLREQILEGAPADVFASADLGNIILVAESGGIVEPHSTLARNTLTIAVPSGNEADVVGVESFADDNLLLGACAPGVPCGDLAQRVFAAAGIDAALDTEEPNVRSLVTKVASGDLDAGIVYFTDVLAQSTTIDRIDIPPDVNVETEYPIAALTDAPNPEGARAFVEFVLSSRAQELLADRGFLVS